MAVCVDGACPTHCKRSVTFLCRLAGYNCGMMTFGGLVSFAAGKRAGGRLRVYGLNPQLRTWDAYDD